MTKRTLTNREVELIATFLNGSSATLDEGIFRITGVPNANDIDDASLQEIDSLVFDCGVCCFWYGIEDLAEDGMCFACADNYEEEFEEDRDEDESDEFEDGGSE